MQINFNNQPKNLEGVEELAQGELSKLERYSTQIEKADIFYKETKNPALGHQVEIKLAVPGPDCFATDEAESYSKAFVQCVQKLEQQLKKRRDYHHNRK